MNPQISQDFERLSAYIDNQLSPAEKAALEARLAQEPQLRAGLEDLRQTVRVLRNLPTVKPPRSFTLTPEQAGARARRGPLFPVLRLAAALCTLLLVVTVARDLTMNGSLSASVANHATTAGSAATPLALPQAALQSPTPEGVSQPYGASAPATTGTPAADLATTPLVRMNTIQPSATPGPTLKGVGPSETPAANASVAGGTGPSSNTAAASSTPEASLTAKVSSSPEETAVSVAALSPAATDTPAPELAPAPQQPEAAPFNTLRLVEIVLAVLALALAGATWLTRRG